MKRESQINLVTRRVRAALPVNVVGNRFLRPKSSNMNSSIKASTNSGFVAFCTVWGRSAPENVPLMSRCPWRINILKRKEHGNR